MILEASASFDFVANFILKCVGEKRKIMNIHIFKGELHLIAAEMLLYCLLRIELVIKLAFLLILRQYFCLHWFARSPCVIFQ